MVPFAAMHRVVLLLAALAAPAVAACGGKPAATPVEAALDLDSDPLALLPGSAVVVANLDAKAMFASASVGAQAGALADALLPLGDDAGFEARRDVDRIVLGVYPSTGADAVALGRPLLYGSALGGGLGVRYRDETPPAPAQWAQALRSRLEGRGLTVMTEPGRAIAGNAGILLTRVELLKPTVHKNFAVIDAAMNDLIRPSFYDAWHEVLPVREHSTALAQRWDLVGPVCESGDWLARDRDLALAEGDLLAFRTAGAYGFTMSSNYNSRPRAAEVLVDGAQMHLARARETFDDLLHGENLLP